MASYKLLILAVIFSISFSLYSKDAKASNSETTYIEKEHKRRLDPRVSNDVQELARSTEFEVYKVSENGSVHTVFESPSGICRGLRSTRGVDFTDATTIYLRPGDEKEYYGNVIGATVYDSKNPNNIQYVPVYVIQDSHLAKKIAQENNKNSKNIISNNLEKNSNVLNEVVCKPE